MSLDPRDRRHILRAANEAIQLNRSSRPDQLLMFLCECSAPRCDIEIELTLEEYATVRSRSDRFAVTRGHEEQTERVLDEFDRYTVVALSRAA